MSQINKNLIIIKKQDRKYKKMQPSRQPKQQTRTTTHIHRHHNPLLSEHDPNNPHIPLQMFLIMPTSQDDYYIGQGKSIRRFLFEGTAINTYTQFEKQKYKQFMNYWQKNKDKLPAIVVQNKFWDYSWKLRWLTSEQFDIKNTVKAMQAYSNYLLTQRFNTDTEAERLLKQGIFYISGRDAHFRPILVFDIDKMIKSKMRQDQIIQTQKFFFQRVLNFYLLPGQVQTWVAIIDVGYQNLTSLIGPMKQSFGFLSNTFRNRMRIAYVVRIPGALSFLWRIVKNFLQEQTVRKINFLDDQVVAPLLQYTNPSQLQKKYGGTQPQITQFWPPRNTKRLEQLKLLDFSHPEVVQIPISQQAYKTRYQKGKLEGHKICQILIDDQIRKQKEEKEKERKSLQPLETAPDQLKEDKIMTQQIIWPQQYQPVPSPQLRAQDCMAWQKLLE